MGSNLSCVAKEKGGPPTDNVYNEADDVDDVGDAVHQSEPSMTSLPPSTSKPHPIIDDHHSNSSDNNNRHHNNAEKSPIRAMPLLPPASKTPLLHDDNGYAIPFPKAAHPVANGGNSQNSSSETKVKPTRKTDDKSNPAPKVGIKTIVLPTNSTAADSPSTTGRETANPNTRKPPDTGAYCNVVLADEKSTKSYSNDLYENTLVQAPQVPQNTRCAVKPAASKDSQLNYIQVEFVNPQEVTPKRAKVKRSPSPTQYTDVINENGVVRLVN